MMSVTLFSRPGACTVRVTIYPPQVHFAPHVWKKSVLLRTAFARFAGYLFSRARHKVIFAEIV
jgi:hypothetical protein